MSAIGSARGRVHAIRKRRHVYGVVFLLLLALVLFEVLAPSADWARAINVALAAAALTAAVASSRAVGHVRRVRALLVSGVGLFIVVGIAAGLFGPAVAFLVVTVLVALIPVALINGLARLIRQAGVTIQVVSGALALYLVVGLLFASIIGFVATVESGAYFSQEGANGERVYYSFTVLTTTGFGDYTAAQPFGHALAVLEMLTGQLYLVTVIGVVVGNFAGRRMRGRRRQEVHNSLAGRWLSPTTWSRRINGWTHRQRVVSVGLTPIAPRRMLSRNRRALRMWQTGVSLHPDAGSRPTDRAIRVGQRRRLLRRPASRCTRRRAPATSGKTARLPRRPPRFSPAVSASTPRRRG